MKKLLLSIALLLSGAHAMGAVPVNLGPQRGPAPTEKECSSARSRLQQKDRKSPEEQARLESIISRCPETHSSPW